MDFAFEAEIFKRLFGLVRAGLVEERLKPVFWSWKERTALAEAEVNLKRDLNGDGVADEVKAFVPDINSPRGVVWNHDHLIVLAPPNVTAFYDRDGDGVADYSKILVSGVGFTLRETHVDHGQNGIEAGIDPDAVPIAYGQALRWYGQYRRINQAA